MKYLATLLRGKDYRIKDKVFIRDVEQPVDEPLASYLRSLTSQFLVRENVAKPATIAETPETETIIYNQVSIGQEEDIHKETIVKKIVKPPKPKSINTGVIGVADLKNYVKE